MFYISKRGIGNNVDEVIRLLNKEHFIVSKNTSSHLKIKRKKIIDNDVSDKLALIRLVQVKGELIFDPNRILVNLNFSRQLLLISLSILFPMILIFLMQKVNLIALIFVYFILVATWFFLSRNLVKQKISNLFERSSHHK